ncbi:Choline-sulfatase [Gimesia panareensis]|uniref:Choline-sulfatase n=1 Tax=Gimesia panareensis TaxID=2527978 RepID=A0A518FR63_9PLAN|nr:sulfatase [Gimesia panareensis]QDV18838.1 Choline-sulfatase [Gimesia panareensis]
MMTSMRLKPAFLLSLFVLCFSLCHPVSAAAGKPNVLFIAVDDLRPELGCYGASHIQSPHIDQLAASGLLFNHAYCQQAVCSPSRTSLMTGLRPDSTKVYDLDTHFRKTVPDVVTLTQQFMQHGYRAVGMGKIYHGSLNDKASWNAYPTVKGRGYQLPETLAAIRERTKGLDVKKMGWRQRSRLTRGPATEMADVPDNQYRDGAIAERAIKSLQELKQSQQPFFLAVGFLKPHLPFVAPKKYWGLYDRKEIKLADNRFQPKNAPSYANTNWGELRNYSDMPAKGDLTDEQQLQLRHGYYACVSFTDANIGKVLDELKRLKLDENTIVILWGDHGWKLGEHNGWCKHTNFENDTRVPLIIRAPGMQAQGKTSEALVEFVDIYPTLCDLAGLPLPAHLEGTSFKPLLTNPQRPWKPAAFSQYPRGRVMGYSMKTDRYRYTEWQDRKSGKVMARELYDHQQDGAENENIAGKPDQKPVVKQLSVQLKKNWKGAVVSN